jgi:carboxymethylenebutenolidase
VDVDAAVNCYGGGVVGPANPDVPIRFTNLEDQLPNLRAPLLGLFGMQDRFPTPELVDRLEKLLKEHGKPYEFHRYDGAGHGFLAPDRQAYNVAAALDGWERITDFYGRYLGTVD